MQIVVGDVHAEFNMLEKLIRRHRNEIPELEAIIIAGDVGLGFPNTSWEEPPFACPDGFKLRFIRGNHDRPDFIRNLPPAYAEAGWEYIPDGTIENGVLYIGSANSHDKKWRTPGYDWWPEEALNYVEQNEIFDKLWFYSGVIHTVVTHDAPACMYTKFGIYDQPSETARYLEQLRRIALTTDLRPTRWIHGHHHKRMLTDIEDTMFHSLPEANGCYYVPL